VLLTLHKKYGDAVKGRKAMREQSIAATALPTAPVNARSTIPGNLTTTIRLKEASYAQ